MPENNKRIGQLEFEIGVLKAWLKAKSLPESQIPEKQRALREKQEELQNLKNQN